MPDALSSRKNQKHPQKINASSAGDGQVAVAPDLSLVHYNKKGVTGPWGNYDF